MWYIMAATVDLINLIFLLGFDPQIILWERGLKPHQRYYLYSLKG